MDYPIRTSRTAWCQTASMDSKDRQPKDTPLPLFQYGVSNCLLTKLQQRPTQAKALLRGFDIVKEFDRVKADGLKAITALRNRHDQVSADRRAASLDGAD